MNPERIRELLTAAVDGTLTPAEGRAVRELLHDSESARRLFTQLKKDSDRIRNLSKVAAPFDMTQAVMGAIRERSLAPTPLPPSRGNRRERRLALLPLWINYASAACVLIMVTIGSYLYFTAADRFNAQANGNKSGTDRRQGDRPGQTGTVDIAAVDPDRISPAKSDTNVAVPIEPRRELIVEAAPSPRMVDEGVLASPSIDFPEIQPFQLDRIRVSKIVSLKELTAGSDAQTKLAAEFAKDELLRLDLFCADAAKGLEMVQRAFATKGLSYHVDAFASDRLKRKLATEIVLFTDSLTPNDVGAALLQVANDDRKLGANNQFDTLVAAPFLATDLDKLGKLLGATNLMPKFPKQKASIDIRKPLPEGTAGQLAASLSKMGTGSSASKNGKNEKPAVIVAYAPMNSHPGNSREIRTFLERRGEKVAGTKPLMLVIRTVK